MKRALLAVMFAGMFLASSGAAAAERPVASFVLAVGVNKSIDDDVSDLRYADDDAVRYFDLFRSLGARTYLVARTDANTERLHPQAAAEARAPRRDALRDAVAAIAGDVKRAREKGVATVLYFVYAGHGNTEGRRAAITLEDGHLTSRDILDEIVDPVGADRVHVIIDACYSYYLAYSRGPGGERRVVSGFSNPDGLAGRRNLGLVLSTSTGRESHEWEAFQAGVFSHEVRSGLYGAADADGDGRVSYREIAAFVERANESVPNEKYRPSAYVRAPADTTTIVDIQRALDRRIEVDGSEHGHYFLESAQGVRLADFHNGKGQTVSLLRPGPAGTLFLRRLRDDKEFRIPQESAVVRVSDLEPVEPESRVRGAAHESFRLLFELPFDLEVVESYPAPVDFTDIDVSSRAPARAAGWRTWAGWTSLGVSAAALASAVGTTLSAKSLRNDIGPGASQERIAGINDDIRTRNIVSGVLYGTAGATALTGMLLLLLPDERPAASLEPSDNGLVLMLGGRF